MRDTVEAIMALGVLVLLVLIAWFTIVGLWIEGDGWILPAKLALTDLVLLWVLMVVYIILYEKEKRGEA